MTRPVFSVSIHDETTSTWEDLDGNGGDITLSDVIAALDRPGKSITITRIG